MSDLEHDPEFEAFLKRRSPMHRRLSDIDHAEPPAELDRLVLGRAREALEPPAQAPIYRATRWAMPLGVAATILIAFTLVLNVDRPGPKLHRQVAAAPAPAQEIAAEKDAADLTANVAAPSAEPSVPAPEPVHMESARALADARMLAKASDSTQTQREQHREKKAEAPVVASAPQERTEAVPAAPEAEPDSSVPNEETVSGPATASARADRNLSGNQALFANRVPLAASSAVGQVAASPPPGAAADPHATVESWLQEIERLRAAGKVVEAERELAAFQEAHPAHTGYSVAKPPAR